jgi:hypothetical protein
MSSRGGIPSSEISQPTQPSPTVSQSTSRGRSSWPAVAVSASSQLVQDGHQQVGHAKARTRPRRWPQLQQWPWKSQQATPSSALGANDHRPPSPIISSQKGNPDAHGRAAHNCSTHVVHHLCLRLYHAAEVLWSRGVALGMKKMKNGRSTSPSIASASMLPQPSMGFSGTRWTNDQFLDNGNTSGRADSVSAWFLDMC